MWGRYGRRLVPTVACAVSAGAVLLAAAPAHATSERFATGQYVRPGGPWVVGNAHTLNGVNASTASYTCINALNVNGGQLAGAGQCSGTNGSALLYYLLCACQLRDGVGYDQSNYYVGYFDYANETY